MFKRILIANRGEIACRVIRTCQALGVETVAIYSNADQDALHVREADIAIHIGAAAPAQSYLHTERIIEAAIGSESQAIHPGYGFLSENAFFARAVTDAGLVFIGPDPQTIESMGSKSQAKRIMEAAGVPVVPGYHGEDQSLKTLCRQAEKIGFPLLVKAAAGGGGKGMRVVHEATEFEPSLAAAMREASSAFGDDRVILERYVEAPRHIEVQVFGDRHGNHVHLFERDCSAQRRYQKIVELAPAPGIDAKTRENLTSAALDAARAVNYTGAGTVEFLLEAGGDFWFMEMNTRLQVEHPVTEMVTGLDLVEWQLRVAAGEPLPLRQPEIHCQGHAIEVRIYAEDPAAGFLPSCGRLSAIYWPEMADVRVETGVTNGDEISVHYDPMIAKLVARAAHADQLFDVILEALSKTAVFGPATNIGFLQRLLNKTSDQVGVVDTTYVDNNLESLVGEEEHEAQTLLPAVVAQLRAQEDGSAATATGSDDPHSPWARLDGWRPAGGAARIVKLVTAMQQWRFLAYSDDASYRIQSDTRQWIVNGHPPLIEIDGQEQVANVYRLEEEIQLVTRQGRVQLTLVDPYDSNVTADEEKHDLLAPMPGRIIAIPVAVGDTVTQDQPLVIMEAMKMELTIRAPRDAIIAALPHTVDEFVDADTLLVHFEEKPA
jgi:3-methylcrotonyl-CoA carboxylase alpha subunit